MKTITDATSKSLSSVTHGTLWFKIETKSKRDISYLSFHVFFKRYKICIVLIFFIFKFCLRQLTIFERIVVAASDFKNCTMVHCDNYPVSLRSVPAEYWFNPGRPVPT